MANSTIDMLNALKAKKAAQVGTSAPAPAMVAPPTPAPAAAVAVPAPSSSLPVPDGINRAAIAALNTPAALPAWATAKVDPMQAAHAARQPYTGAAGAAPAAAAPLGINPPESALPPAPAVGTNEQPAAETAKRTRRTKAEMEAARAAAEGGASTAPATPAATDAPQTVRVVWGAERVSPVAYNHFDVGPFEATGIVQPNELPAAAMIRIYAELSDFAEAARAAKAASFAAAIGGGK